MQATSRSHSNHDNENVRYIGQGEPRHRKYKRLKLGDCQAYDRSSDETAVVAGAINNRAVSAVLSPDNVTVISKL
jgi:hypothetical protein